MVKIKKILVLFLFSVTLFAQAQQVRVMSYNLHNYPNGQDANFKKIISAINPDALIVVEMLQSSGVSNFQQNSLNSDYTSASYVGSYNDCAFYYKASVFTLLSSKSFYAITRDISEFKLRVISTGDTLVVLGVHLKAYNDSDSAEKRNQETLSIRSETRNFASNVNYLVCGDFNIFSSNEVAFQNLTSTSINNGKGYFIDMMNVTGDWNGNSTFNNVCTWSTGNGGSNTLNTRFDMFLVSPSIMATGGIDYKNFVIYGNDGNRWNKTVTYGTNAFFPSDPSIGTAIYNASDHYPVYVDLTVDVTPPTAVEAFNEIPKQYDLKQNYPNPFNPSTEISYQLPVSGHVSLKVYDLTGREIATLVNEEKSAGSYHVKFDAGKLSSGIYLYCLQSAGNMLMKKMVYLK